MTDFLTTIAAQQRVALFAFGLRQIGDVDAEPITLAQARAHLRVDLFGSPPESDDDDEIELLLPAARQYCEMYAGVALASRTMELATAAFPSYAETTPPGAAFVLPFGPVQSVTSIVYTDSDGVDQTLADTVYELDVYAKPARVILKYGEVWPTARAQHNAVRVQYVAGYSTPGFSPQVHILPAMAAAAVLLMLGHLFKNREAVNATTSVAELPLGVRSLLDLCPWRENSGFA